MDPRRAGFAPSGGRFSYSFFCSESIAKAVLWAKLAQAYAQHRFTSLCNFYMWISTATDSKSRSTNTYLDGLTTFRLDGTWFPRGPAASGRPKSHSRSQLGPRVPQLGLSRPILGTEKRPRSFSSRFWTLEAQKQRKIQFFCCIFFLLVGKVISAPETSITVLLTDSKDSLP